MSLRPGFLPYVSTRPSLFASIGLSTASPRYSTSSTIATTAPQSDRQTITLPDGRLLGFAEYGQPDGKPLLYFHGYPASRREAAPIAKEVRERGIRLISVDRPGIGASTYHPGRTLSDYAEDMRALADALELKRFAVLGGSGGGPYAVACANGLPSDRLSVAGVFASGPPWEVGTEHVSTSRRVLGYLAERWPRLLKGLMSTCVSVSRWLLKRQWVQKKLDVWLVAVMKKANENEGKPVETPTQEKLDEVREQIVDPFLDHFEQGTEGFLQETQILVRPWGFPFEDVKGRVQIYHGTQDSNAAVQMMRILAKRLPNCDMQEFEKDNHYTMGRHMVEAMVKLVSEDENRRV